MEFVFTLGSPTACHYFIEVLHLIKTMNHFHQTQLMDGFLVVQWFLFSVSSYFF